MAGKGKEAWWGADGVWVGKGQGSRLHSQRVTGTPVLRVKVGSERCFHWAVLRSDL